MFWAQGRTTRGGMQHAAICRAAFTAGRYSPPMRRASWGILLCLTLAAGSLQPVSTARADQPAPAVERCGQAPPWSGGTPSSIEGGLHRMAPARVMDTRYTLGEIGAGCEVIVDTSGVVPEAATAVSLVVTATESDARGYVTVHPCDQEAPTASNLNTRPAVTVANGVVVPVEASRRVCLFTSVATQLIVDVYGWFGIDGDPFHGLVPDRLMDTRSGPRPDGGSGPLAGGSVTRIPIAGRGSVPAQATGVTLNVTVTETADRGYLTVFPCGTSTTVSSVNYEAQDTRANLVITGLDASGFVCVQTYATVAVVIDVSGWFGGDDGDRLVPLVGTRVLDSRTGTGGWTGAIPAGETRAVDVGLNGALPVGRNVVLSLVATNAVGGGYLSVFPCGLPRPPSSSLNLIPGEDVANLAGLPVGSDGQVCVFASNETHVVIDVIGSLGSPGPLLDLSVSGGPPAAPYKLTTPFNPDGHNYGVICQPGSNTWTVATNAVHGATVTVAGATPGGSVTVSPGQAVVVTVTPASAAPVEYWVRCLPSDFPKMTAARRDKVVPGWYLAASLNSHYAVILDDHGAPVWYQDTHAPVIDVKLLPDGNLAWTKLLGATYGTTPDGAYEVRTFEGALVRTWASVGAITDHHDLQPTAGGTMLMISYHQRDDVDVSALGPQYSSPSSVVDTWIQELSPAGAVVWSWHSEDHLDVTETVAQEDNPGILATPGSPTQVLDLIHTNSVEQDPATGDLIVSARHLDAVFRVRRDPGQADDGKVLWKLGGNAPTDSATTHLTIAGDSFGGPRRQHDARLLPNGHLTLFDNESFHPGTSSRGVEYALDLGAGTARLVQAWGRTDGAQAFGLGSMRRQADGSTVVGWGAISQLFSEYLPGHAVRPAMTVGSAPGTQNYRVVKLPSASLDQSVLRHTSGSPQTG